MSVISKNGKVLIGENGKAASFDGLVQQANQVTGQDDKTVEEQIESLIEKIESEKFYGPQWFDFKLNYVNPKKIDLTALGNPGKNTIADPTYWSYGGHANQFAYFCQNVNTNSNGGQFNALEEFIFVDWVKTLGLSMFYNCDNLKRLYGFNDVRALGQNAFQNCRSLKTFTFGRRNIFSSGTSSIERNTFNGCTALQYLIILDKEGVCSLVNTNGFKDSSIQNQTGYVYVPDQLVDDYKIATNWTSYQSQIVGYSSLPQYDNQQAYSWGDCIKYNGSIYKYINNQSQQGNNPSDSKDNQYWEYLIEV